MSETTENPIRDAIRDAIGEHEVVLRHPLTLRPKPVTFPSHRTAHVLGRRLVELEARPSLARAARVVAAAVRG